MQGVPDRHPTRDDGPWTARLVPHGVVMNPEADPPNFRPLVEIGQDREAALNAVVEGWLRPIDPSWDINQILDSEGTLRDVALFDANTGEPIDLGELIRRVEERLGPPADAQFMGRSDLAIRLVGCQVYVCNCNELVIRPRFLATDTSFGGAARGSRVGIREIDFHNTRFGDWAVFFGATFGNAARFVGATFGDGAWFGGTTFGDGAWFGGTTFGDWAGFDPRPSATGPGLSARASATGPASRRDLRRRSLFLRRDIRGCFSCRRELSQSFAL